MPDATDDIGALGLPKKLEQVLRDYGLASVGDVTGWTAREVLSIPGVGAASVVLVKRALDDAGLSLTSDPNEAYVCARHDARAWDARLVSFILCGDCLTEFTSAFRESPPLFNEVFFGGYCQNCNLVFDALHMAQWNLCGNCERVSRSIGRSIAAERFVVQEFERDMEGSGLTLEQIDQPVLRPHDALVLAQKTASIDFMLRRDGEAIAGFELKTGVNGQVDVLAGGHRRSPLVANKSPRV